MTDDAHHCPPSGVLVAAASRTADRATRQRVADHVISCQRCAEQLRVLEALQPWADEHAGLVTDSDAVQWRPTVGSRWSSAAGWRFAQRQRWRLRRPG